MFIIEVVEALNQARVSYAIAGGYAVALHGVVRGTVDLDLVIALTEKDYIHCECALKSLGLHPKLPVTGQDVFRFRKEYMKNRNLKAWSFYDPKDPTRLVDIIITYGKRKILIKNFNIAGKRVRVLAKDELIRMKKIAGRPQDFEDIKALERPL